MKVKLRLIILFVLLVSLLCVFSSCGNSQGEHETGHDVEHQAEDTHDLEETAHEHGDEHEEGIIELSEEQEKYIAVKINTVATGMLSETRALTGEVKMNQDKLRHIVSKTPGIVEEVLVSIGDNVRKGAVLARLASEELAEAKAEYLEKYRAFSIADKAYKRKKYLYQEKVTSERELLEKEAAYLNAETELKTSIVKLAIYGLTEREIANLPDEDPARFSIYEIRAPFDATVISRNLINGNKVTDESELFLIADLQTVWVDFNIAANELGRVEKGRDISILSPDGHRATGKIINVSPTLTRDTRTALARVELDNAGLKWKPGTFVTGYIETGETRRALLVDADAVQMIEGRSVVFIPEEHGYAVADVTIGRKSDGKVVILGGLKEGDSYVSGGAFELKSILITNSIDPHAGHGH